MQTRNRFLANVALVAGMVVATAAHAQVATFTPYDDFNTRDGIDANRWLDGEQTRGIKNRALNLKSRAHGALMSSPPSGAPAAGYNESFRNPGAITAMRAKVTVNAIEANACPDAGAAVGQSRARLVGGFFNTLATPNSQAGDVIAQFRIRRTTDSTLPAGILRVQALVSLCNDPACLTGPIIGSLLEFGTIKVGQSAVLQMEWDNASNSFYFSRDGAPGQTVSYSDVVTNMGPPWVLFRQLSTRLEVPNCSSTRISNSIDASFDDVFVNAQ